ncbi:hypothetical protein M8R20_07515 [Pseudomonas sp. R2.Fl]|nr:hypothetical protein [Pseudomonas sp. R2.Fl]
MTFASPTSSVERVRGLSAVSPRLVLFPATLLSFLFSGYVPVLNNNVYHLPIMLRSYDLPQFHDDAFVQSLRHFSSGFWLVFAGIGRHVDPKLFLAFWLVVTHFAFLAACLHFARSLGYRDNRQLNLYVLLLSVSSLTIGMTIGGGGLMINYFTHSELANASMILGLSYALGRRYGHAAVATCLAFFLNAFMAVWMVPSLLLLAMYQLGAGELPVRRLLRDGLVGSAVGLVFLVPPLLSIAQNPEIAATSVFSYRQFLWDFYPYHFFLESLSRGELIKLGVLVLILFLSATMHGDQSRAFMMISLGAITVVLAGVVVPLVTDNRLFLNLHLIRGAALVAILAPISLAAVASHWLFSRDNPTTERFGPALCGVLLAPVQMSPLAVIMLLYARLLAKLDPFRSLSQKLSRNMAWVFFAICVLGLPIRSYNSIEPSIDETHAEVLWERIGTWASEQTREETTFLLFSLSGEFPEAGFGVSSMRKLWISSKYGAAVMWSPSYYDIWESRKAALRWDMTAEERLAFARNASVDYVAMACADSAPAEPIHREGGICVYKIDNSAG